MIALKYMSTGHTHHERIPLQQRSRISKDACANHVCRNIWQASKKSKMKNKLDDINRKELSRHGVYGRSIQGRSCEGQCIRVAYV